ncbi:MAG: PRTRC system protein C [Rhodoferax sp.]|nr:PRTRC system protein C [Rhodoferax sp.]MDP3653789.1 PRTRC system protein C [Rhodoferax sp.]
MSIEVHEIQRRFRYNGIQLPDVPGLEPREVRDLYSAQYPELVSAEVEPGEVRDGVQEFTFRKAVGTKGATHRTGSRLAALLAEVGAEADGGVSGADGKLVKAMSRSSVNRCAQAWSAFVQRAYTANPRQRDGSRLTPPSEALAPLP